MPSRRTSHIRSATLTISARSQTCHRAKLSEKQVGITPHPSDTFSSSPISTQTQQLLLKARQLATTESQRTGRRVAMMDVILESTLPKATVQPYRCAPSRTQLHPVRKIYASKDLGKMELYWDKRATIVKLCTAAYSVTKHKISAERSTIPWPPNLDDKSVSRIV